MKKCTTFKTVLRIVGIIAIIAVIGLAITACDNGSDGDEGNRVFTNFDDVSKYLSAQKENTSDSPYTIKINISYLRSYSGLKEAFNGYERIGKEYDYLIRYVILDFSSSTFDKVPSYAFNRLTGSSGMGSWWTVAGKIVGIILPDSVTSIEHDAFYYCDCLTSFTIPDSVTRIEDNAFLKCTSLTSVTIGNGVTVIGYNAFKDCIGLTSVTIPDNVRGLYGFSGCTGLTSVTIGSGVTRIGAEAFLNCTGLTSIIIPNSVTSIGSNAFQGCTGLTSVTIGNGVTVIEYNAFKDCILNSVTIPDSVTSIEYRAFYCNTLTSVTFQGEKITVDKFGSFNFNSGNPIHYDSPFMGNLRDMYLFSESGSIGTYTRASSGTTWTKQ